MSDKRRIMWPENITDDELERTTRAAKNMEGRVALAWIPRTGTFAWYTSNHDTGDE